MLDFFADFTHNTFNETTDATSPRGVKIIASSMQDALSQITLIEFFDPDYALERISKKPTRGMEYRLVMEWSK